MKEHVDKSVNPATVRCFDQGCLIGKSVLVTGDGSGPGRCTAHEMISLGATPIMIGRIPRNRLRFETSCLLIIRKV